MRAWVLAALAACGGNARYLGAQLPDACERLDVERCAGWMAERDLVAGQLDAYDDPILRAYVQRVTDRLTRGSTLTRSPRIVISDHDGTYAAFGERIVIGRMAIERLGSEAELAAIVAHELVHVEGRHAALSLTGASDEATDLVNDEETWLAARRDAEAIADERAVTLLERAGYAPAAMERALAAVLEADDPEHPPRADRLAAAKKLAAGRTEGFEGRDAFLGHLDGMVVGRNTRLGVRIDDAWVVAALGVAIDIPTKHVVRIDGDALVLRRGRSVLTMYSIGPAWARELASELEDRARVDSALGPVTVGIAPERAPARTPIAKLQRAVREQLPQPSAGTQVIVLGRDDGGLVLELGTRTDPFVRDQWLAGLRVTTKHERRRAEPTRIELEVAEQTAMIAVLVNQCVDPNAALHLDDPERVVERGEAFKCTTAEYPRD